MKHFWHTLHSCGHAAFWNNADVAADMHMKQKCPWCCCEIDVGSSIVRDEVRGVEARVFEHQATIDEVGTIALYHHRRDERCCTVRIAATIGANESNVIDE
jgi:hypothetical protein